MVERSLWSIRKKDRYLGIFPQIVLVFDFSCFFGNDVFETNFGGDFRTVAVVFRQYVRTAEFAFLATLLLHF